MMTPLRVTIQELRMGKGWSQAELAKRARVSRFTVMRIENGRMVDGKLEPVGSIDLDVLEKLAKALGVSPGALIASVDEGTKPKPRRRR